LAQFDFEAALFGGQGRPDCVEAAQILSARLERELEAANAQAARAAEAETGIEELASRALQREMDGSASWSRPPRPAAFVAADGAAAEPAATDGAQSEASTEGYQIVWPSEPRPPPPPPTRSPADSGFFSALPAVSLPAPASSHSRPSDGYGGFGAISSFANCSYVREGQFHYLIPREGPAGPQPNQRIRVQWWLELNPNGYHKCLLCNKPASNEHLDSANHKKKVFWLSNLTWAQQKRSHALSPDAGDETIFEWW
jgi:hypothetical protein